MLTHTHTKPGRDRHGRGLVGPLLPQGVPAFITKSQAFDRAVLRAYADIHADYAEELRGLDLASDTVPRMRFHSDPLDIPPEVVVDGIVPLGRLISPGVDPSGRPTRARIVLFRRPLEKRASTKEELEDLLHRVLVQLVAQYLNVSPEDIDPDDEW